MYVNIPYLYQRPPQIAILPLGTGNDLSRALGWGVGHSGAVIANDFLDSIRRATAVQLDRWKVHIDPATYMGIRLPTKASCHEIGYRTLMIILTGLILYGITVS